MINYSRNTELNSFIQFVKNLDFTKIYTKNIRIFCHSLMWFCYLVLHIIHFSFGPKFSIETTLILSIRTVLNDIIVFYLFFYVLLPFILRLNNSFKCTLFLVALLFPLLIYIWLIMDYLFFKIFNNIGIEFNDEVYKGYIEKISHSSFYEIIGYKALLGNLFTIVLSISVSILIKVLFDSLRLFSNTLKIQQEKSDLEIQNIKIEKDFLKAQLNPHFLFNTLNNLYRLSLKKDDKAPDVILNLSDIMGYSLYESNAEKVLLYKELEFIENYFALEKMRYPSSYSIQLNIEENEKVTSLMIAPLLTFTFIENAFKYGLKNEETAHLSISVSILKNKFSFKIINDISDLAQNNTAEKKGIGLSNIKRRLELLYHNQYELEIKKTKSEFSVSLVINL